MPNSALPSLYDALPAPPAGQRGWPWERPPQQAFDARRDPREWPKISVISPSYNQGEFVEAMLRSVLLQDYPNLEYIVLDGGSTDHSADVIRRYEPWLTYWHSRKDAGQADALATGFRMSTGEIQCWLNSDDILLPGALLTVARLFASHRTADVVYGNRFVIDAAGEVTGRHIWPAHLTASHWSLGQPMAQECTFWRRDIYERVGGIDPTRFFIMDYDLFFRMWRVGKFLKTPQFLGCLRIHEETKNSRHTDIWQRELGEARLRYHLREPGYLGIRLLNRLNALQLRWEEWRASSTSIDPAHAGLRMRAGA